MSADGYRIVDSGDPDAKWEVIDPDGRTVSIVSSKKEAREVIRGDKAEKRHQGRQEHWFYR